MIKISLFIGVFFTFSIFSFSQVELDLSHSGKADYRKLLTQNRAFQIYKKNSEKVFYMLQGNYYNFDGVNDTLEFVISGDSTNFDIELEKENKAFSVRFKKDVLSFISEDKRMDFEVKISQSKKNTISSPIKKGELEEDTELGMVIVQNRLIRYAKVELNNQNFNIAILDKNKNGKVDKNDFICLSFDEFFTTKESLTATLLKKETILKVGDYFYKILWNSGYQLKIEPLLYHENPKLILSQSIPDLILSDDNVLSNLVQHKKYTILSFWSVYSPSSRETIKELNQLDNVIGFHLNEEVDLDNYKIDFLNYFVSQQEMDDIGANGYPYFIVVNRKLERIGEYRLLKDIPEKFRLD